jgi:hypothetical protein
VLELRNDWELDGLDDGRISNFQGIDDSNSLGFDSCMHRNATLWLEPFKCKLRLGQVALFPTGQVTPIDSPMS